MPFTIFGILAKFLGAIGAPEGLLDDVKVWLEKAKTEFPDAEQRITALTAKLQEILGPYLDPATTTATLAGIARDLVTGTTGVDQQAWGLSI